MWPRAGDPVKPALVYMLERQSELNQRWSCHILFQSSVRHDTVGQHSSNVPPSLRSFLGVVGAVVCRQVLKIAPSNHAISICLSSKVQRVLCILMLSDDRPVTDRGKMDRIMKLKKANWKLPRLVQ